MLELYRNQVDIQLINAKLDERSKGLNLGRFVDLAIVLQSVKMVYFVQLRNACHEDKPSSM